MTMYLRSMSILRIRALSVVVTWQVKAHVRKTDVPLTSDVVSNHDSL